MKGHPVLGRRFSDPQTESWVNVTLLGKMTMYDI